MKHLIDTIGYVPRTCVWEITRACNLNCRHCGSCAGARRDHELTTEQCVDVIHQLAALGNRLTTLSGGEPTLRDDWPLLARTAVEAGLTVNMVTNGQTRDPATLARQARDSGLANVAVSLDGLAATHDEIRKAGAFERSCETIRTLAQEGVWVDVMLTANRLNLHQVEGVYRLAGSLGARGFRVQLGKPMGNQTGQADLTLAPRDLTVLLPTLARLAKGPGPVVNIGDSVGYYSPYDQLLRGHCSSQGCWTGCYAGVQAIGIQSDGTVKGCLSLQPRAGEPDPFIEGDLHRSSLEEIWFRPGAFAYNRDFDPADLSGHCARCSYGPVCRGGARCVAHAFTGELFNDPMCYHAVVVAERRGRRAFVTRSAAAAATALLLAVGGAGCLEPEEPSTDAGVDGDVETFVCDDVDCSAGPEGVDAAAYDECCCADVCCECDYGFPPPGCCDEAPPPEPTCDDVDCSAPDGADPALFDECCCADVCCECDYGFPPPGCCEAAPTTCEELDCAAGPEGADPALFDECCCADVCCECDYGFPPPEGCCPGA